MELIDVNEIYKTFKNSKHQTLVDSLIKYAVRYSRIRVDWYLSNLEERNELEEERIITHNELISACDILSRNMLESGESNEWKVKIGNDRKVIGDFACLLYAILGINARLKLCNYILI